MAFKDRVAKLSEGGMALKDIAARLGTSSTRVRNALWRIRNPEYETTYRRLRGVKPLAEHTAARRSSAMERAAAIQPLIADGLTYTEAGKRLGFSRNVIAGLQYRAKRRAEARAS